MNMEISKYPARRSVFRFVAVKSKRPRLHDTAIIPLWRGRRGRFFPRNS